MAAESKQLLIEPKIDGDHRITITSLSSSTPSPSWTSSHDDELTTLRHHRDSLQVQLAALKDPSILASSVNRMINSISVETVPRGDDLNRDVAMRTRNRIDPFDAPYDHNVGIEWRGDYRGSTFPIALFCSLNCLLMGCGALFAMFCALIAIYHKSKVFHHCWYLCLRVCF
jgi:hypothetical protein